MTPAEALARMAQTIQGFARGYASAGRDSALIELPGVVASICPAIGIRSIFNAAAYTDAAALGSALPILRERFAKADVYAWGVWAHESDRVAARHLEAAGLKRDSAPTAMAAELPAIGADQVAAGERAEDLEEFDAVLARAYEFPPGAFVYSFPRLLDAFNCCLSRDASGNAVAALATFDCEGDCGFTLVGTDPDARGNGYASALMSHALAEAGERGCETTTLQATAMGKPLYTRLGYAELGAYVLWEHRVPAPWESTTGGETH